MKGGIILFIAALLAVGLLAACRQVTSGPVAIDTPPPATSGPAAAAVAPTDPVAEGSIAVLLPAGAPPQWAGYFSDAFTAAAANYTIYTAADSATQAAQAAEALATDARVIVLHQVDDAAGAAVMEAATAAGIEVIGFGRLTTSGPGPDLYVGYDDRLAGRLLVEGLAPLIDASPADPPRVVVLNGPPGDGIAALMRAGLDETLAPRLSAGEWRLAGDLAVDGWDEAQAAAELAALLDSGQAIDAVLATDDRLAAAAASALAARGLPAVPLSGRGATPAAARRLLAGQQSLTLYTPARLEAAAAAAAAIDLLHGDEIPSLTNDTLANGQADVPYIRLRPLVVTADDIEAVLVGDGHLTWEEICAEGLETDCPPGE